LPLSRDAFAFAILRQSVACEKIMKTSEANQQTFSEQIASDYHILSLLGEGGMGQVFLAEQLQVGRRQVALKVLRRDCSQNPELTRRFQNEAASAGRINHRNIVTIYESRITDDGQLYVAMEYVKGKTLTAYLAEAGALPLKEVIEITQQVAAGLAAAHSFGIVHRDIKPDNLMLAVDDGATLVKILDFGIARLAETPGGLRRTQMGTVIGTPAYMSPEQASGKTGKQIDERSDTYSLGLVVYEMLTGKSPFEVTTSMEFLAKHIHDRPIPLSRRRPDFFLPMAMERVVFKALEKDPAHRQQTVTDFAKELQAAIASDVKFSATPQSEIPTVYAEVSESRQPNSYSTVFEPNENLQSPATSPVSGSGKISAGGQPAPSLQNNRQLRWWLFAGLLLIMAVTVYVGVKGFGEKPASTVTAAEPPIAVKPATLIEYQIKLERPTAELETLAENNVVKSGEFFAFEVKLLTSGSLYFFSQYSAKNDGSWRWLNAPESEKEPLPEAGKWLQIPQKNWIGMDGDAGVERYLIVYVPKEVNWSPVKMSGKKAPFNKTGVMEISGANTVEIMAYLRQEAVQLNSAVERRNRRVCFSLSAPEKTNRLAFYEIYVNHTR
jgi:serine/threonine protein kinase